MRPVEPEVRPGVRRGDQREGGSRRRPHQQRRGHDVPLHQGKHDELGYGLSLLGCVNLRLAATLLSLEGVMSGVATGSVILHVWITPICPVK